MKVASDIPLYGKKIKVNRTTTERKQLDIGAKIFVSNLAPEVDENTLKYAFMQFGQFASEPQVSFLPFYYY